MPPASADAHGIELTDLRWVDRTGQPRDLRDDLIRQENSLTIPLRDSGGFGNRKCTSRYKIEVVAREIKRRGWTADAPAKVAIGFSVDEVERVNPGVPAAQPWTDKVHPLIELGLHRRHCYEIVAAAGLPEPPKSSCHFCPFQGEAQWREMRDNDPEEWASAVEIDALMRARHIALRGDPAGLAHPTIPLAEAIDDQLSLDLTGAACGDSCFT